MSLEGFINDFLMAIFFLSVGIELKYELTAGVLTNPRQAMMPILAACGGVAAPALIYTLLNWGGAQGGWAVPIATDIAFALGIMSLAGDKVAPAAKVFFSTLAIADDLLGIIVIALFYGQAPSLPWLAASAVVCLALWGLTRLQVYHSRWYIVLGLVLWFCMLNSGVHATLAGVILAFFLPVKSDIKLENVQDWLNDRGDELDDAYDPELHVLGQHGFTRTARRVENIMHRVTPPLQRVETAIATPVNFLILPLFAFANAQLRLVGVDPASILSDPVAQGVFLGLVLGKPHRHRRCDGAAGKDRLLSPAGRLQLGPDALRGRARRRRLHHVHPDLRAFVRQRPRAARRKVRCACRECVRKPARPCAPQHHARAGQPPLQRPVTNYESVSSGRSAPPRAPRHDKVASVPRTATPWRFE